MPVPHAATAAICAGLLLVLPATSGSATPAPARVAAGVFVECEDFQGPSALGSPLETVAGVGQAGTVRVRRVEGAVAPQTITAASLGLPPGADRFGFATSAELVNSTDSCTDLVVGMPGANGGAGRVVVIPGSGDGLGLERALVLDGTGAGIVAGDNLGAAVSTVRTDAGVLVVAGAPNHDAPGIPDAGAVVTWLIPFGGVAGALPPAGQPALWMQGAGGLLGSAEPYDHFGSVLVQSVQSSDNVLTVGVPDEDIGARVDAGAVAQITFGVTGVVGSKLIWEGSGMPGRAQKGDRFGAAVSAAGSRIDAIGIPGKDANGRRDSGAAIVLNPRGGYKLITQNTPGVPDSSEKGDNFGAALGSLFGMRGIEVYTIAVGAPGEDRSGRRDVGAVTLVDVGEVAKLAYASQKTSGLPSRARFGQFVQVVLGDVNLDEDRRDVLLVGAPGSNPAGPGKYWRAAPSGITAWESGLYFATQ